MLLLWGASPWEMDVDELMARLRTEIVAARAALELAVKEALARDLSGINGSRDKLGLRT